MMCIRKSRRDRDMLDMLFYAMVVLCLGLVVGHASAANVTTDTTTVSGQTIITYTCDIHKTNLTAYWVAPGGVTSVWYTMVGGGGGGGGSPSGGSGAGGGGGGGLINGTISVTPSTNYTIFVGRGGAGGTVVMSESDYGQKGINSTAFGLTAVGGGGGGVTNNPGTSGATGGGSGNGAEDRAQPITLSPVQGHQGGLGYLAPYYPGGGGGGAGEDGQDAAAGKGGNGGAGAASSITGSEAYYGGGGGGGSDDGSWGSGGTGGGGHGYLAFLAGTAGTDGLGGGGGGDDSISAGGGKDGGNGVIIIRYTTPVAPVASFTQNVTEGNAPAAIQFNDTSTNSPSSWSWKFKNVTGNNTQIEFATTQNPSYTFGVGNWSFNLTATNDAGSDTSKANHWFNVSQSITPIVKFTANITEGLQNLPVQFTDESFTDITDWYYDFDNGNTSTEQNPVFTFTTLGDHHVTLKVTNASGYNTSSSQTITVLQRYAPIAAFTANITSGYAPLHVQFNDDSVLDPTGWVWNFTFGMGTANTSTEQNPIYTYSEVGTYTAKLYVTNASGTNTTTMTITTTQAPLPPVCMFTPATNRTVLWPAGIKLTSTSTNTPTNMSWSWGDGVTTYGNVSSKHIYVFPGIYYINVSATNAGGTTYNDTYVQVIL